VKFSSPLWINNGLAMVMGVAFFILPMGCQGVKLAAPPAQVQSESMPELRLGPGDTIDIKFFYVPELNESQTIRPDGKITLQLMGEIDVWRKTPSELQRDLMKCYAKELKQPEIAVIVRSLSDRRVYVGGEVNKPGVIAMPGQLTALEAIMEAGGFKMETAKVKNVVVIHYGDGKYRGNLIDFRDHLRGKDVQPFFLNPRDIVYVPHATIVKVDQWVDQYIYKVLPISRAGIGMYWTP
jgi:polysaccharide export outer membrane protein